MFYFRVIKLLFLEKYYLQRKIIFMDQYLLTRWLVRSWKYHKAKNIGTDLKVKEELI